MVDCRSVARFGRASPAQRRLPKLFASLWLLNMLCTTHEVHAFRGLHFQQHQQATFVSRTETNVERIGYRRHDQSPTAVRLASDSHVDGSSANHVDEEAIQWELFQKHQAKGGDSTSWKGIWTTYNYIGDVEDETVAAVNYDMDGREAIAHSHQIVVGAKRSDCATCFDSMETKTFPVTQYAPDDMKKMRLASCGLVNGPTLLRTGAMALELALSFGDGRVRVLFQYAPVWERGVEPDTGPPDGLKLFRTMVAREALRDTAPTAETEGQQPPTVGNPIFYRPVPPFNWHKKWAGTSWTWGSNLGDRGWSIVELEEEDSWHGNAPVALWNLRLPGGVFVQAPRIITGAGEFLCRLAWLPTDENLLRVESGVVALQPMALDDDTVTAFAPPSLASLRCDVLRNVGDLEGDPPFARDRTAEKPKESAKQLDDATDGSVAPKPAAADKPPVEQASKDDEDPDSGLKAIRDALKL